MIDNIMKKLIAFLLIVCLASSCATTNTQQARVKTGIEVLRADDFRILKGKRVGLITNPTGVDNNMKSTVDIFYESPNVNLVALYGPEHGVRGNFHAGSYVESQNDNITGIPVYSLYGSTRKPTKEMLKNIDVLVYDIQDIGCRSFTFISTMGLAMEAAAENNIEFVVLDRPNPLGGLKIEGSYVEDKFKSFVGQYKIPYIYGLTCGELALMINGEKMMKRQGNLQIVKMKRWNRKMTYAETGLQWIAPSPHIPQAVTAFYYPSSGVLGELGVLSTGVGYTLPFQLFGAEWINAEEFSRALNSLNLEGLYFRPIYYNPFYGSGTGKSYQGVQVHITDYEKAILSEIQFHVLQVANRLYPGKVNIANASENGIAMFDKVIGSDYIRLNFQKNVRFDDIRNYWRKDEDSFRKLSKKYQLY
jgi:Uncharacterized protein conserved in bacteria